MHCETQPSLHNVVATVNLGCRLSPQSIAWRTRNAEYNPKVCQTDGALYGVLILIAVNGATDNSTRI